MWLQPREGNFGGKTRAWASEGWTFNISQSFFREATTELLKDSLKFAVWLDKTVQNMFDISP